MMFPVQEVCGGKGLVDECPPPLIFDHASHNTQGL
jgi:hypothetical protein